MLVNFAGVKSLRFIGGTATDYYTLVSSPANLALVDSGGGTLDFSKDTKGITLNLGLSSRQTQTIAPWGKTLALQGVFDNLIGTPYNDVLAGGAGTGVIRGDGGNNVLRAGSGNAVLVNGSGNSTAYGGSGTCLLIAGSGTSTLYGGSGIDMLVGGSTSYDANDSDALLSILAAIPNDIATSRSRFPTTPVGAGSYSLVMGKTATDSGRGGILVAGTGRTWFLPGAHDTVKQ